MIAITSASGLALALCLLVSTRGGHAWTAPLPSSSSRQHANYFGHRQHRHRFRHHGHHGTSRVVHQHHHNRRQSSVASSLQFAPDTVESSSSSLIDLFDDIDESTTFPILKISHRIGSGSYGTVHSGYLLRAKDDVVVPCIAKRAWTYSELSEKVPSKIMDADRAKKEEGMAVAQRTGVTIAQATGLVVAQGTGLTIAQRTGLITSNSYDNEDEEGSVGEGSESMLSPEELQLRAERCQHYWEVERHCFQKMEDRIKKKNDHIGERATPAFLGVYRDDGLPLGDGETDDPAYGTLDGGETKSKDNGWFSNNNAGEEGVGHPWMVFEFVGSTSDDHDDAPAQTLLDAMELDWRDQHLQSDNHHLYDIQKAMDLPEEYTFGESLDAIFISLLENLKEIHECNIVHRDLKPGNLLCDAANQKLRLIDFGSAADLDPSPSSGGGGGLENLFSGGMQRVGYDEGIVAISPVYSAPETFVKLNENPLAFDVFSAGLIMSQLLFNLLDERTDAGFLQQLKEVEYDLDAWLEKELGAKLRVGGFDDGIEYLGERRGLWALLKRMFAEDPTMRISSAEALERFRQIIGLRNGDIEWSDGIIMEVARDESYFETVVESFERCNVNLGPENMPRPLHFLASFRKGTPVGLVLSEASEVEKDGSMSDDEWGEWQVATRNALPGEVFVRGLEAGGQADQFGIFEIGDRLRGVGELPFVDGGFEQAINLIKRQPGKSQFLRLHFDRIPAPKNAPQSDLTMGESRFVRVSGQGAWKSGGRRGNQEDAFVLHEIKNDPMGDVLLAGVFDGHAGTAASETCSSILPSLFTAELLASSGEYSPIRKSLENSWETTCNTYRDGCDENGECVADYDPTEGILYAETGSKDLFVAGTTATIAAISMNPSGTDELTILNCGDSRTLLVGSPDADNSVVIFETRDHSPDDELEIERLRRGNAEGLDYSIPVCSMTTGSYMVVGDYQYALCRSLEGSWVTSKGIVSDPDVTTLNLSRSLTDRQQCALVLACDGLFEVMSNEEVGREVVRMRDEGYKAGDVAKNLCGQALKKGSYDNLSVVVVYLDK
eukprot:CAMPEP_0183716110 /NCGR_PEP_ID=MMETSP0737-20130205/10120_1 /TAXON_ID=385413 /ORGANISM="Thalassiosira miniscula, Strain CCMP1093" /LENGTH=1061 /DNA_ID=CAMNT_0025945321 /DNA_START=142 /DNA_END=3327 /DNA_ORIENTATION=+